jgi:oligogalacturonide lyase
MNLGAFSCSADGRTVCTVLAEDLSDRLHLDMGHGYVGFAEYSAARPLCRIVAIDVDSGESRLLHEEQRWFTHLNGSTRLPDVFTVCHEGPWDRIEQRMWRLDVADGSLTALRPQTPDEAIGHEYWFADGERLGFHGRKAGVHLFGHIRFDGSDHREYDFPHGSFHFHSMDETLIVGDGHREQPWILLWKLVDGRYQGPRRLLTHRGSWHVQFLHVHPRMFAGDDGATRIVYTADPQGYGNVYIADVGEFESLPMVTDPPLAR